jgi:hypothetical protein
VIRRHALRLADDQRQADARVHTEHSEPRDEHVAAPRIDHDPVLPLRHPPDLTRVEGEGAVADAGDLHSYRGVLRARDARGDRDRGDDDKRANETCEHR